jgi:hypothetical protein
LVIRNPSTSTCGVSALQHNFDLTGGDGKTSNYKVELGEQCRRFPLSIQIADCSPLCP